MVSSNLTRNLNSGFRGNTLTKIFFKFGKAGKLSSEVKSLCHIYQYSLDRNNGQFFVKNESIAQKLFTFNSVKLSNVDKEDNESEVNLLL